MIIKEKKIQGECKMKTYMIHEILEQTDLSENDKFVRAQYVEHLEQKVKELNQAISDNYENHPLKKAWEESQTKLSAAEKEIERLKGELKKCYQFISDNRLDPRVERLESENATLKAQLEKCKEQRNHFMSSVEVAKFEAELAQLRKNEE